MTWRNRSACLDEDPELFFPIGNTYPALLQIEEAKVVCRRCEVVETCSKWGSESGQDRGGWGGLSADERHSSNAEMPVPVAPAESHHLLGEELGGPPPSPGPKARVRGGSSPPNMKSGSRPEQ